MAARSSGEEASEGDGPRDEDPQGIAAESGTSRENAPGLSGSASPGESEAGLDGPGEVPTPAGVADAEMPRASRPSGPLRWPEDFSTEALLQNPAETLRRARESETYDALSVAELVARRGDARGAISLLEAYQGEETRELELDEVWFRMAGLLEREEEARDLRRAVELYERIVDEYPLSVYYEPSRQRVEYLKRHFFLVR